MRSKRALSLSLVAIASVGTVAWISARRASATPALEMPNKALGGAMQQMNDALKALSKPVTAENRTAALAELAKFEAALLIAKAETPDSAAKVDEKKRAAYLSEFRKTLVDTLKLACEAEDAILDNKFKDADTLIRNKLGAMKSTGHSKYKEEGGK